MVLSRGRNTCHMIKNKRQINKISLKFTKLNKSDFVIVKYIFMNMDPFVFFSLSVHYIETKNYECENRYYHKHLTVMVTFV